MIAPNPISGNGKASGNGVDIIPADEQAPPRDLADGERTTAQTNLLGGAWGGMFGTPGGGYWPGGPFGPTAADPYTFGKWNTPWYWGTYQTYRLILNHPRIRQARAVLTSPIVASPWEVEADEGVPEERSKLIQDQLFPLRRAFKSDVLRAADFGWAGFEKVWEIRKGQYWLKRLKPLSVDRTHILQDHDHGNYAGLDQGGTRLGVYEAFLYTFDGEAGNLYGRSLLENARTTGWRHWVDAAVQLHRIGEKLADRLPIFKVPSGEYTGPDGKTKINFVTEATNNLNNVPNGQGLVIAKPYPKPQPGMTPGDFAKMVEALSVEFEVIDCGSHSPAIAGQLSRMAAAEDLMFAAYLQSSRTGMQSEHGSRADAQQHTDTGLVTSELIDQDIADAVNRGIVDDILELNYGPETRGTVRLKAVPIQDQKKAVYLAAYTTALADPAVGPSLFKITNFDGVMDHLQISRVNKASANDAVAEAVDTAAKQKQQALDKPAAPVAGQPGDKAVEKAAVQLSRLLGDEDVLELAADSGDGHWITEEGTHIFIKGGVVEKGPNRKDAV